MSSGHAAHTRTTDYVAVPEEAAGLLGCAQCHEGIPGGFQGFVPAPTLLKIAIFIGGGAPAAHGQPMKMLPKTSP